MDISLIANSGIQFYQFKIEIDENSDIMKPVGFAEEQEVDENYSPVIRLQYAYRMPDDDIWLSKEVLRESEAIDKYDNIDYEHENLSYAKDLKLKEGENQFSISDVSDALELFSSRDEETIWLPLPYFKLNNQNETLRFGPTAWSRMVLRLLPDESDKKIKVYEVVLAFDTQTEEDHVYFKPSMNDTAKNDNTFGLSNNEDYILNFFDTNRHCGWVNDYTKEIYLKREGKTEITQFPYMKYVAEYIYFIKYLEASKQFPRVTLHTNQREAIDVDFVLDVGNANSCGLLFESPLKGSNFEFTSVQKLKIQDLSSPFNTYTEPFSMRLAFAKSNFSAKLMVEKEDEEDNIYHELEGIDLVISDIERDKRPFRWASILRLGEEASRLITEHHVDTNVGVETANHHSSPKRYLWDDRKVNLPWEFVNDSGKVLGSHSSGLYINGLSQQFNDTGELLESSDTPNTVLNPFYSKKSLMTFAYIEIFLHALSQINSFDFRRQHGNPDKPRRLRRVTITCPTSIIQYEQITLRKLANHAIQAISKMFPAMFSVEDEKDKPIVDIIPAPKELSKDPKEKQDWIYDEATCGQLVFLYSEISKRYLNKADIFFNLYGKKRNDVDDADLHSLTIGSVDIGGGTTDLMICAYQYAEGQGQAVVKPHPLYWESFNLAGDDLLKNIIQQVILEGEEINEDAKEYFGVIRNEAIKHGVQGVTNKILAFFGTDKNEQGHLARIYRKNFIVQVATPIALRYLQHASNAEAPNEVILKYEDFFPYHKPNPELINAFNEHFNDSDDPKGWTFKFEDIEWKLSKQYIASVVETIFDPMLKQLSVIMSAYGCDFVLTAGRPTTIPKVRELFIKYYPTSPERIINMHTYRVGRWYPYTNQKGYINDPKTVVAVGGLIGLMGGKIGKLDGFKLDTKYLKRKLISTADYIGPIEKSTKNIKALYVSPDENKARIDVHALPVLVGYKQLPNETYNARPIYKLDFNDVRIAQKIMDNDASLSEDDVAMYVSDYKDKLRNRFPLNLKIRRSYRQNKEAVEIEAIRDCDKNDMSPRFFIFSEMTLLNEQGYWLDTGEFVLSIKEA